MAVKVEGLDNEMWELEYRDDLKPAFGKTRPDEKKILINSTIPGIVQSSVFIHEMSHTRDDPKESTLKKEIRANWYSFTNAPFKWCCCLGLSLILPYRWKLYYNKIFG